MIDGVELPDVMCYVFLDNDVNFCVIEEIARTIEADMKSGDAEFVEFVDIAGARHVFRSSRIGGVSITTTETRRRDTQVGKLLKQENPDFEED